MEKVRKMTSGRRFRGDQRRLEAPLGDSPTSSSTATDAGYSHAKGTDRPEQWAGDVGIKHERTEIREKNRTPKHSGFAKRGPTAGLPLRHSTFVHEHMTTQDALALIDAADYATSIGKPLNGHLTVTWQSSPDFAKDDPLSWSAHHQALVRAMSDFLKRNGVPVAFLCARENVVGRGGHSHYLFHMPPDEWQRIVPELSQYIMARMKLNDPRAVLITPGGASTRGANAPYDQWFLVRYLLRSLSPIEQVPMADPLLDHLGLEHKPGASLPFGLKRVAWSQNIGESARKRAGRNDRSSLLDLDEFISNPPPRLGRLLRPIAPAVVKFC